MYRQLLSIESPDQFLKYSLRMWNANYFENILFFDTRIIKCERLIKARLPSMTLEVDITISDDDMMVISFCSRVSPQT